MKRYQLIILLLLLVFLAILITILLNNKEKNDANQETATVSEEAKSLSTEQLQSSTDKEESALETKSLVAPIEKWQDRITKKPFGIYVDSQSSPVTPEKFNGYHNAVDFEIFEGEENKDIPIKAICEGKIVKKDHVSGYGGLLVQSCNINNQPVTVLYGHIRLSSVSFKTGDVLKPGQNFAVLGTGYSSETDGERKHLHLGIHKGTQIDVKGYVKNKQELSNWIDITTLL